MKNQVRGSLIFFIFFILLADIQVNAQDAGSGKAGKYFEKAREYYDRGEWQSCKDELYKAIKADSTFPSSYIMMGDLYLDEGNDTLAVDQFKKALRFNPEREYVVMSVLANTLFSMEQYAEASIWYSKVLEFEELSADYKTSVRNSLKMASERQYLMEHPVSFQPVNLGLAVNSKAEEYINALTADGKGIYFTRRMKSREEPGRDFVEDFYLALIEGNNMQNAELLNFPPGKTNDAGAICISPDGRLLFFTACYRKDSFGSCDLYYSEKEGDEWSTAKNMGSHINSDFWDAQPAISPDGRELYFTSNRPGGEGSSDIWKTIRSADGSWARPVNLGKPVNTSGQEMAPFIHFDNQVLYFSSGGHGGMGGTDLFRSKRIPDGWSEPENLGYPVNSKADEIVIVVNPAGDEGYISNNNLAGFGGYDIYRFELDSAIRPDPVSYLQGVVFDAITNQPLEARFELVDIERNVTVISAVSDRLNGDFLVCLPLNHNYALNISCEGYLFYSEHFPFAEIKSLTDPLRKDIPLEPVKAGNKMILRNIFFDTDEYQLKPESFTELNKLFDFMKDNPSIRIEIGGHTDDQGTDEYNLSLSDNRARAVFDYLVQKGIASQRMNYKGYGESMPESSNQTEEGRALNRRTEITIISAN